MLKGIQHAVWSAAELGVESIDVSNHIGQQIDSVTGAADALVDIVTAVGDQTRIVFDSGIISEADIFKDLEIDAYVVTASTP